MKKLIPWILGLCLGVGLLYAGQANVQDSLKAFDRDVVSLRWFVSPDGSNSFLRIIGTLPTTPTAFTYGAIAQITSSGNQAFDQTALLGQIIPGYTGSSQTIGIYGYNTAAGTGGAGAANPGGGFVGNIGTRGLAAGVTTGTNIGIHGYAAGTGGGNNIGGVFNSRFFGGGTATSQAIGLWSIGGDPTHDLAVGGVFALGSSEEAAVEDAVILADSCHFTTPLLILKDRGTNVFEVSTAGNLLLNRTITTVGTTGNRTIDKPSGTVNIAAGGTTVTVTDNLVNTSSIIYVVVRTNDTTARVANVVPGAGNFIINTPAVTAETSFGFLVTN